MMSVYVDDRKIQTFSSYDLAKAYKNEWKIFYGSRITIVHEP